MNVALGWGWFDDDAMCLRCVCPCKLYYLFVQVSSVWITWRTTRTYTPAQRPWTSRSSPSRLRACSWLQPTSNNTAAETAVDKSLSSQSNPRVSPGRDSRSGSGIYRWTNASFQLYQNISTQEARSWKHFTIDDKVSASSMDEEFKELSTKPWA